MPLDVKKLFEEIDLPVDLLEKEDVKEVKEVFFKAFVNRNIADSDPDIVNKITGKRMGALTTTFGRAFGITSSELEGKKLEDLFAQASEAHKKRTQELEEAAKAGGGKPNADAEKWKKERDQFELQLKEANELRQKEKEEYTGTLKKTKLSMTLRDIEGKIPVVDNADELKMLGLKTKLAQKYVFDLDEKEQPFVRDTKGEMIPNGKGSGFKTVEDVLKEEYQAAGLLKLNPGGAPPKKVLKGPDGNDAPPVAGRKLPANAIANANRSV